MHSDGDEGEIAFVYSLYSDGHTFESANEQYDTRVSQLNIRQCMVCKEGHLLSGECSGDYTCTRDKGKIRLNEPNWFGSMYANPGYAPAYLPKLSLVESQLIAPVAIQQLIYRRGLLGPIATKGHCLALSFDIQTVVDVLPRVAADVPIIIIQQVGTRFAPNRDFRVRRAVVEQWLLWLRNNNMAPKFRSLRISQVNLDLLPTDGPMTGLRIEEDPVVNVAMNPGNAQEFDYFLGGEEDSADTSIGALSQTMTRSCSLVDSLSSQAGQEPHDQLTTDYSGMNCPLRRLPLESEALGHILEELFPPATDEPEPEIPVFTIPPLSE